MADGYERDREEHEHGGNGGFMMGLLTGTVLGAGLGMLFAPKSGTDLRHQIGEQANSLGRAAGEQYRRASDAATGIAEKARERIDQTKERVGRVAEDLRSEARERAGDAADFAKSTGSTYTGGGASGYTSEPHRPDRS
jgi:gas vesicle protein